MDLIGRRFGTGKRKHTSVRFSTQDMAVKVIAEAARVGICQTDGKVRGSFSPCPRLSCLMPQTCTEFRSAGLPVLAQVRICCLSETWRAAVSLWSPTKPEGFVF